MLALIKWDLVGGGHKCEGEKKKQDTTGKYLDITYASCVYEK